MAINTKKTKKKKKPEEKIIANEFIYKTESDSLTRKTNLRIPK